MAHHKESSVQLGQAQQDIVASKFVRPAPSPSLGAKSGQEIGIRYCTARSGVGAANIIPLAAASMRRSSMSREAAPMPEGPEIRRVATRIHKVLAGREAQKVLLTQPKVARLDHSCRVSGWSG